jgi:hypothetical protein
MGEAGDREPVGGIVRGQSPDEVREGESAAGVIGVVEVDEIEVAGWEVDG